MIDCDIHVQIGDREQFLGFVEPGQRDWFREQGPLLGTPGYTWVHPTGFMRGELEPGAGGMPASTPDLVRRELLDPYGIDVGLLTADDGIAVSLMASPYRAAAYACAHNDWLRDCWLDADPRLRGTIIVPAQDPLAAAAEIKRVSKDARFARCCCAAGPSDPTAIRATCRCSPRRQSTDCPSPSPPVRRDWASRPAPAGRACPVSTSSGTRWARPAAS